MVKFIKSLNQIYLYTGLLIVATISSCNSTKYVPKDKYLLDRNILNIDNKTVNKTELESFIKQKPNKRILRAFRFHLGLYNLSKPGNNGLISRKLRKIGEEPSVYDELLKERSVEQIKLYLKNKGYYSSLITDSVIKKNREVKVYYNIRTRKPLQIDKVYYKIEDKQISSFIISDTTNCLIKEKSVFDIDILQNERVRLESLLKNLGYFNFTKDYIYFEADSSLGNNKVNIYLGVRNYQKRFTDGTTQETAHPKYIVKNVKVEIEEDKTNDSTDVATLVKDSIKLNNIWIVFDRLFSVNPQLIENNIYIVENNIFDQKSVDETYRNLSSLRIFKYVNILFSEVVSDSDSLKAINCLIQLSTVDFQSYQSEAELTNSAGLGVAGSFVYQHKNLFKNAELLDLKFKGATEAIKNRQEYDIKSTLELGVEARIQLQKFLLPFNAEDFARKYNPKTYFLASYNYMRRIQYTHRIISTTYGYTWKGNKYNSFIVNPVDINIVKLIDFDKAFLDSLSTPYKYSFTDHLVAVTSFSFTFNNQKPKKNTPFYFLKLNFESAGNSLRLLSKAFNLPKDTDNMYQLLQIKFAQYLKGDIDLRYYQPVNETDRVVYRFFSGLVFPYGNSQTVPFEKQYFSGGPNSIRAWEVRNLGPGEYKDPKALPYPDKAADIKLEANIEYRFKLFWLIEGALFLDAGNIWSINKYDGREGALFEFNKFYNQIAIGTGFGTRFDFSFFIFRIDLGFKLRDPSELAGNRWTFNRKVTRSFFNPTFGIGYPF